jgi:Tfp pilus assembly protein FimT
MKRLLDKNGFTFVEVVVIAGIAAALISTAVINLYGVQQKNTLTATVDTLVADIKDQQIKTMVRDTEGQSTASQYGVHLKSDKYILFRGSSYNPADTTALTVNLNGARISTTSFPAAQFVFASGSGEIVGAGTVTNTIVIKDLNNAEQKTISINPYGIIVSAN